MTPHDTQRDRLRRTISWARAIEQHLATVRTRHLGEVHFRPSSAAIAMVGLHPDRPQRGKSSITNLARLAADFPRQFATHCIDCDHGRPTPEKRLQSHLVADAYRSDRRLVSLAAPGEPPPLFVTDELALPTADGKLVCDILALAPEPDAEHHQHQSRAAVIELKSSRDKTRLVRQVTAYAALVDAHLDLVAELFSVILHRTVTLQAPTQRMIVWPHPAGHDRDPSEDELAALGIRVAGYIPTDTGFTLQLGRRPVQPRA